MEVDHCDNALVAGRAGFDIVSSLPLELVIPIVEYLDQADVLRCQRVRHLPILAMVDFTFLTQAVPGLEAMALDFLIQCHHQRRFAQYACGTGPGYSEYPEQRQPNDLTFVGSLACELVAR